MTTLHRAAGERFTVELTLNGQRRCGEAEPRMGGAGEGFLSAAGYSIDIDTPANKKFVAAFRKEFQSDPDLFAADTYGLFYLFKQAIEKAGGADEQKLRAAMEDASWETPQGTKKMRKGDHQAIVDMQWRRKP